MKALMHKAMLYLQLGDENFEIDKYDIKVDFFRIGKFP